MDSEQRYYMDESFAKETNLELTENLQQIKELFLLLNTEEKVMCKRMIAEQKIF